MLKKLNRGLCFIIFFGFLVGCVNVSSSNDMKAIKASTVMQKCAFQNAHLIKKIEEGGVQVILVGETMTLVLSSDQFFDGNTVELNRNHLPTLNKIADLLNGVDKFSVQVAGYTDSVGDPLINVALSRQEANTIANYLWKRGIDTRVISSMGYGAANPIADNDTLVGRAMNRRIEIALRLLTVPDDM